jgi:hypothetical protein
MVKKLLSVLLIGATVHADWFDDMAMTFGDKIEYDDAQALEIITKVVQQDEKEVADLEKRLEAHEPDSFWATLKGGTLQMQWAAAKATLNYHKKVKEVIAELPHNKKDRTSFISSLKAVLRNINERKALDEEYAKLNDLTEKMRVGALIAAKEVEMRGRKAFMKSKFALS